MKTEDLIQSLAAETPAPPLNPPRLAAIIAGAVVLSAGLFLALLHPRPDLGLAWENPVVPLKTILPAVLFAISVTLLLRLARPEAQAGRLPLGYLVPGAVAVVLWIGTFWQRAPGTRFAEVGVASLAECLGFITLLSIIPTFVALRVMRAGASVSPGLSGALAGLTAASGVTIGYSLFCTQDNPLFFLTWYSVAMGLVTLIAARLGRRWLAW